MLLNKLTIQGFKSFANRTILNFDQGITAIVGPNGSGKSNIVDAIRWVLGEQSQKNLRGKRGEDIIFAGSERKKRLGLAEVSLTLTNIGREISLQALSNKKPLSFSEITIKRRFYRNGEGEYFLNRGRVRLKDIEEFLAQASLSPKNYTILGQGMIDKVISLNPQEKRELFLEASQAKPLALKQEEASLKLKRTAENLVRIYDLINEIKPHLSSLKRQTRRAQKKEIIERNLEALQKIWYQRKLKDMGKAAQKILEQKQNTRQLLAALEAKIKNLKKFIQKTEFARQETQKNGQTLSQKQAAWREEEQEIQKNIAILEGQREANPRDPLFPTQREILSLQKEAQDIDQEIKSIKEKIETEEKKITQKQKGLASLIAQKQTSDSVSAALTYPEIQESLENLLKKQKEILENFKKGIDIVFLKKQILKIYHLLQTLLARFRPNPTSQIKNSESKLSEFNPVKCRFAAISPKAELFNRVKSEINFLTNSLAIQRQKIDFLNYQKETFQNKIKFLENNLALRKPDQTQGREKIKKELFRLKKEVSQKDAAIEAINQEIKKLQQLEQQNQDKIFKLERSLREKQDQIHLLQRNLMSINLEEAKLSLRQEEWQKEIKKELGVVWGKMDLNKIPGEAEEDDDALERKIDKLKRARELAGGGDPAIIQEYEETQKRYDFLQKEAEDLGKAQQTLNRLVAKLSSIIRRRFNLTFKQINKSFQKYFRQLLGGGRASLTPEEDGGITIYACPPGKRLVNTDMLSGGEKSLVGICLIFALLSQNPPPFCVLDEADAALDEANSTRFARILKTLSLKTQFLVVTHNRETLKSAPILYGVTMGEEGVSKLLSIKLEK